MSTIHTGNSGPVDPADNFCMQLLDQWVKFCQQQGIPGVEGLQRMAYQATIGVRELAYVQGGDQHAEDALQHLFQQISEVLRARKTSFIFRLKAKKEDPGAD